MRKLLFTTSSVAALLAAAFLLSAQPPAGAPGGKGAPGKGGGKAAAPPAIVQIKPGFYEITGLGGNTSVRVGNDAVFVADLKNMGEENYQQLIALIKTVTPLPVKAAAVSHVHQDHSGNTASFIRDGADVWAHEGEKKLTETYVSNGQKVGAPSKTYAKDQTITLGNARIELHHYGPAHTGGDTIVYFPDLKIVHAGDVVSNPSPNCDLVNGGSAVNWVKVMDEIMKLDFDTMIPGHGNVMTRAEAQEYTNKWKTFVDRAVAEVKKGTPKEGLLAAIKVDDIPGFTTQSYGQAGRLDLFYAELQKAAK
jgi:glyoxylase-like metal-dependent hydrolase (beta-lactamase superfamily II)